MKKHLFLFSIFTVSALFSFSASAITATGNAKAKIRKQITASETTQMDFGTISPDSTAGSVVLSSSGTLTSVPANYQTYGTTSAGSFSISGQPNTTITASIAPSTISNGTNTMPLTAFTTSPSTLTTNSSGALTINTGATLGISASQATGDYTGTYTLTVNY